VKTSILSHIGYYAKLRKGFPGFPEMPLPFYPRSAGETRLPFGKDETGSGQDKPFVQITWVSWGRGTMLAGGESEAVEAGDVVFQYPKEARENRPGQCGLVLRWLTFDGPGAGSFLRSFGFPRVLHGAGRCPEKIFVRYETALGEGTPGAFREAVAAAVEILVAAGHVQYNSEQKDIQLVRAYSGAAERHYADPSVNAGTLCEMLNFHRATVSRAFRMNRRETPGECLRSIRLRHALERLAAGDSVAETARRCGFWNASYFTQAVRHMTGQTPKHFRKMRQ